MSLEKVVNERISFLKEQISPSNKPSINRVFEVQIEAIRKTDPEKIALNILQKKKQLEYCRNASEIEDRLTEIEALEWLQRQVVKHIA